MKKKTKKTDETELVRTSLARLELDTCSPCKYASFATILKKNGQELHVLQPKQYVTFKIRLAQQLVVIVFWNVEKYYHYKMFIFTHYKLHTTVITYSIY